MADNPIQLMGDYSPDVDPRFMTTPRSGLSALGEKVRYVAGCSDNYCDSYDASGVKAAVTDADLTVVCLGTGR